MQRYAGRIDTEIIKYYKDPDIYQWYNTGDPDLHPIRTKLPECPDWHTIENFGLPANKQYLNREQFPQKLSYLINKTASKVRADKTLNSVQKKDDAFADIAWKELATSKYEEVNQWIAQQWYYRMYGKWVFIYGKPTYICGSEWFYYNYWHIESVGLPDYRDRDRKWFWAMEYFSKDTTAPKYDINENGDKLVLYNEDGSLQLEDLGYRTIDGVNIIKGRRMGDTTKASCCMYLDVSITIDGKGGIQGDKEKTGEQVFREKLMFAFKKLPFFWKPKVDLNVKNHLSFESDHENSLGGRIDYGPASKGAYDGRALDFYHGDEVGKLQRESVHERHSIVRRCLRRGAKLRGFAIYTTTVDDMDLTSGKEFERLCNSSMYEERTTAGFTQTGMVNIHFPSYEGYEGFIGPYGESVVDTPTQRQLKHISHKIKDKEGEYMGAREYIESEREAYREAGNYEDVSLHKRLYPLSFAESFSPPAKNVYFNIDVLETRILELKRDNEARLQGDFIGRADGKVDFRPSSEGRFFVSKLMDKSKSSQKQSINGVYYPYMADQFVASADAFRLEKTDGGRLSNGGGAVKWKRDARLDPDDKPVGEWQSARIVCTYSYRPDTIDEYCDDMLKMCVYYGAMMYPERNIEHVSKYFIEEGFGGYLLYDTDPESGKPKNNAGFFSGGAMKQKMFNLTRDYIQNHGKRDRHMEYLLECLSIRGLDDMTNYDLFTACAGCHLAEESNYSSYLSNDTSFEIGGLI